MYIGRSLVEIKKVRWSTPLKLDVSTSIRTQKSSSEEAGTQFFRFLTRREVAVAVLRNLFTEINISIKLRTPTVIPRAHYGVINTYALFGAVSAMEKKSLHCRRNADVSCVIFGRPLGLGLCHRKSVRPSVRLWPNGLSDRYDFGTHLALDNSDHVLDGGPNPPTEGGTSPR